MTEKIERIARTVLWAVLALVVVAIPVGVAKSQSGAESVRTEMKAELKKAEDKIGELSKPKGPEKVELGELGSTGQIYLSGLLYGASKGILTFTNTTAKEGFLCLKGVAKNAKTGASEESIPTCKQIKPYDSNVSLGFEFASGSLHKTCPQEGDCNFSVAKIDQP